MLFYLSVCFIILLVNKLNNGSFNGITSSAESHQNCIRQCNSSVLPVINIIIDIDIIADKVTNFKPLQFCRGFFSAARSSVEPWQTQRTTAAVSITQCHPAGCKSETYQQVRLSNGADSRCAGKRTKDCRDDKLNGVY